jgi:UDP-N-acetylglucosamine enolpyruvyl transferase
MAGRLGGGAAAFNCGANAVEHRAHVVIRPQLTLGAPSARVPVVTDDLRVIGGRPLNGSVTTSGFKHSLVTVLAAAAAGDSTVHIGNCPDIQETAVLAGLLRDLGAVVDHAGRTLTVRVADVDGWGAGAESAAGSIHGAVYLIPALLRKSGRARLMTGGGCRIGDGPARGRPVEQYVSVLERFGAQAKVLPTGELDVTAAALRGTEIDLLDYTHDRALRTGPLYSGATKMALLCAAVADGTSVVRHLYPKPDVTDLVDVLGRLGAQIEHPDPDTVVVHGRRGTDLRHDVRHTLVPDLIEVVTWICVGATLCDQPLVIRGTGLDRAVRGLAPELDVLRRMGVGLASDAATLTVPPAPRLRPVELTVASHGVYSDSQPLLVLLATGARGVSRISDTVWGSRFTYADGLAALGARITRDGAAVTVTGPHRPVRPGQHLTATDLRAAAALLIAALAVPGATTISGAHHLARGYADLPGALRGLGADIQPCG